ncbi:unnamed protein product, partial [Prunus brigantina]
EELSVKLPQKKSYGFSLLLSLSVYLSTFAFGGTAPHIVFSLKALRIPHFLRLMRSGYCLFYFLLSISAQPSLDLLVVSTVCLSLSGLSLFVFHPLLCFIAHLFLFW